LSAQRDRNALISVRKAMEFARAKEQVREFRLERGVIVTILNVLQHTIKHSYIDLANRTATTALHSFPMDFDGLLDCKINDVH
jgi:uncharacterized protein YecE (DUF72 family)